MTYLGKQVGHGQVRPVMAKISSINEFPVPKTRRELRRFWVWLVIIDVSAVISPLLLHH